MGHTSTNMVQSVYSRYDVEAAEKMANMQPDLLGLKKSVPINPVAEDADKQIELEKLKK
jgi:hypothetical protein